MKNSAWKFLWTSKDIRNKLLITLLILVIYRFAANVPVPGIDRAAFQSVLAQGGAGTNFVNLLDLLSGGAVSNFSILAMSVYPYITAQIIIQLLAPIIPALEQKMKDEGQKWMEKWTVILTIPMALLSAIGQINIFGQMMQGQGELLTSSGFGIPVVTTVISMIAGTMFGIWLGQLISEYGIPNQGLSLIILSGVVSRIPTNLAALLSQEGWWWLLIIVLVLLAFTIFAVVYVQEGKRNVPVLFPGRRVGTRMSMPVRSSIPLRVNMAGMIPLIFAQTLLSFPAIVASYFTGSETVWVANAAAWVYDTFGGGNTWYIIIFFLMVVGFTFFYTTVLFEQQAYGDNLKKQGAQIPGVSRGAQTQRYLSKVQNRITLPGALFLGFVAVLPYIVTAILNVSNASILLISSSGLLIVVGTVRDTFNIIETELKLHGYDDNLIGR
ncbi:MAG: preprotein translocase subunit SecY [Anaerolineae bacterium]|jgi:preprotein translocase subunit SecY|nr:preprotein translocase subunit SecY [Anaerolineae bacterium]